MSRCALLATLALVVASVAAPLAPAAAATACWQQVVDDWFDGRIEGTYAPHCYREALRHLPADAREYTTASGDIERALLAAIRAQRPVAPRAAGSGSSTRSLQSFSLTADRSPVPVRDERPLFERIAGFGASSSSSALPLPIVLVGVLTALLVAAAAISRLGQRRRAAQGSSSQPDGRSRRASSRPS